MIAQKGFVTELDDTESDDREVVTYSDREKEIAATASAVDPIKIQWNEMRKYLTQVQEYRNGMSIKNRKRPLSGCVGRFHKLKEEWQRDIQFNSSTTDISTHPAYQQIIGMGPIAIPLILQELATEVGHWFWALKAITGIDPVPAKDRGRVKAMADAWIKWGKSQGYMV